MNTPFFSVIIPLYNKEKYINRSILAVLSQSFTNFELLIINDGSHDNSVVEVKKHHDKRIRLISQSNKGPALARNLGIKESISDFICFLDADDEWDIGFLEHMHGLINLCPDASFYSLGHRIIDEQNKVFHRHSIVKNQKNPERYIVDFYGEYSRTDIVNSSTSCARKIALNKIGNFPKTSQSGEDIYTWLKLADRGRFAYSSQCFSTIYRNVENRFSSTKIPYHISKILKGGANEFSIKNRKAVIKFVHKNAILQLIGAVLNCNRKKAFQISTIILRSNLFYGSVGLLFSLTPRFFLHYLRKTKNQFGE